MMTGMTLKDIRLESGLKIAKITEELGLSRSQFYCIERARNKLNKLKAEKLASIYKLPVEDIKNAWEVQYEQTN